MSVTGDLDVVARGDATVIGQVVDNLVVNAVRHGGAGDRHPVDIRVGAEAGRAVIRASDLDGDLVIDDTWRDGACFVASLPLGTRQNGAAGG